MYVLVQDFQVKQFGLPQYGTLKNGSTVSNYDLLPQEVLKEEGWLPLEENKPQYNEMTEMLQFVNYDILSDKVIANYIAVPVPVQEPETPTPSIEDRVKAAEDAITALMGV